MQLSFGEMITTCTWHDKNTVKYRHESHFTNLTSLWLQLWSVKYRHESHFTNLTSLWLQLWSVLLLWKYWYYELALVLSITMNCVFFSQISLAKSPLLLYFALEILKVGVLLSGDVYTVNLRKLIFGRTLISLQCKMKLKYFISENVHFFVFAITYCAVLNEKGCLYE